MLNFTTTRHYTSIGKAPELHRLVLGTLKNMTLSLVKNINHLF